jgi:hypothetical protein
MVEDNDVVEGDIVEVEGGERNLPATLPYGVGNMPQLNSTRSIIVPNGDLSVLMSNRKRVQFTKSRPGPGGTNITYTGWTNTADMLDYALGPLGWSIEVVEFLEYPKPDPSAAGQVIIEYVAHCRFHAIGLIHPMDVYGSHPYQSKNPNASHSDAMESAISKALSKAGARISEKMRSVWGKDDVAMQELSGPSEMQLKGLGMLMTQVDNMGKEKEVDKVLKKHKVDRNGIKGLSAAEVNVIQREIAELM